MKIYFFSAVVLCCALASCSDKPKPSAPSAPEPAPVAAAPAPAKSVPAITEADARALVERWAALQNAGDFAHYAELYEARFYGVKRSGPRTRTFDRKGWLADRERMFKHPMRVAVSDVRVSLSSKLAVVTFAQDWSTASYHDQGPKRLVLVQNGSTLRISSEELLSSSQQVSATPARLVVSVLKGPSFVMLGPTDAPSSDEPATFSLGYPTLMTFALKGDVPEEAKPWLAGPVRLIGADSTCEAKPKAVRTMSLAYVHGEVVLAWSGKHEDFPTPPPLKQMVSELRDMAKQQLLVVELESSCMPSPQLALASAAPAPKLFSAKKANDDLDTLARTAFANLSWVQAFDQFGRDELLSNLRITSFGNATDPWVAVSGVASCGAGTQGMALFHMQNQKLELVLDSEQTQLTWADVLVDLDGNGVPEVVGSGDYGEPRMILSADGKGKELFHLEIPFYDCPC